MVEENITQLAVAVCGEDIHERITNSHLLVRVQTVEVNGAEVMTHARHVDHSTLTALIQMVQKQVGQQEVTNVVDTKHHPQAILCGAWHVNT